MSERDRMELKQKNELLINDLREDFEDFRMRTSEQNSDRWKNYSKEEEMERQSLYNKVSELYRGDKSDVYQFHQDNPFRDSVDAYEKGIALYGAGKLEESILAFESIVEKDPLNSEVNHFLFFFTFYFYF